MPAEHINLGIRAFGRNANSPVIVKYQSHRDALHFLDAALRRSNGVGLLQGPIGSGKSTVARELAQRISGNTAIALVDGSRLKSRELLLAMLEQFGQSGQSDFDDELLKAVSEFAANQTRAYQPPVLIVDNADRMHPAALRLVSALAGLTVRQQFSMRIILTGQDDLTALTESDGMKSFADRRPDTYSLQPLMAKEAMIYLHTRLEAVGGRSADTIFPFDVSDRLREQADGWPGPLNQCALEAIERAERFPISLVDTCASPSMIERPSAHVPILDMYEAADDGPPTLVITSDGELVDEFEIIEKKVLIGRSEFADVVIPDGYASKMHAVLLLYPDALMILDLNSANGTTVNSVKVQSTLLKSDDIISLGHHRIKIQNAPAASDEMQKLMEVPDTLRMKSLTDIRRMRARQYTKLADNRENRR